MITRMDRDLGVIFDRLKSLEIDGETLVFFTSDNGPHKEGGGDPEFFNSSGPLRGYKRDLYEGGIRVPMIVRWPGKVKAGRVSDQVWAFWDVLPTACDLANVEPPGGIDGLSVLPTIVNSGPQKQHEYLYWEFHEGGFRQAVRLDKFKAVRLKPDQPIELYDLSRDVGESTDIAAKHPDVIAKVKNIMAAARTDSEEWPVP
jgi:arylsulfatase A-like enzyme